jgi:hypothetical protein
VLSPAETRPTGLVKPETTGLQVYWSGLGKVVALTAALVEVGVNGTMVGCAEGEGVYVCVDVSGTKSVGMVVAAYSEVPVQLATNTIVPIIGINTLFRIFIPHLSSDLEFINPL